MNCSEQLRCGSGLQVLKHKFQSVGKRYTPSWSGLPALGFKCVCPVRLSAKSMTSSFIRYIFNAPVFLAWFRSNINRQLFLILIRSFMITRHIFPPRL